MSPHRGCFSPALGKLASPHHSTFLTLRWAQASVPSRCLSELLPQMSLFARKRGRQGWGSSGELAEHPQGSWLNLQRHRSKYFTAGLWQDYTAVFISWLRSNEGPAISLTLSDTNPHPPSFLVSRDPASTHKGRPGLHSINVCSD